MAMPPDPQPTSDDPRKPPSANPAGGAGGIAVAPPEPGGAPRWRGPVLVAGAILLTLVVLLLVF